MSMQHLPGWRDSSAVNSFGLSINTETQLFEAPLTDQLRHISKLLRVTIFKNSHLYYSRHVSISFLEMLGVFGCHAEATTQTRWQWTCSSLLSTCSDVIDSTLYLKLHVYHFLLFPHLLSSRGVQRWTELPSPTFAQRLHGWVRAGWTSCVDTLAPCFTLQCRGDHAFAVSLLRDGLTRRDLTGWSINVLINKWHPFLFSGHRCCTSSGCVARR